VRRAAGAAGAAGVAAAALLLFCVLWPELSPYGANDVDFDVSRDPPSLAHPLGTDQFGRDLLTRLAAAGRVSLAITAAALAIILVVGFVYGSVAGLLGGRVDAVMMRLLDGLLAMPRLPVSIVLLVVLDARAQTIWAVVLALSILSWMLTARLVRGHVLVLRQSDHIGAARAIGASRPRILLRHVFPNTFGILAVAVLLELPGVILGEAFLSLLGLGPNPPTATWGNVALDGIRFHRLWQVTLATAAIVTVAVLANLLADRLQEAADPRRRGPIAGDG
jgi:ABC-type dipeptide/oligopeptide/nickel transport system permease subunit